MDTLQRILDRYMLHDHLEKLPVPIRGMRRDDLGPLFRDLAFTKGAEIGVWKGKFSEVLLKSNPMLHMTCVDPWVSYKAYIDHTRHDQIAGAYEQAKERLSHYPTTIIREFSASAAQDVPDGSLDFVYIDGNHSYLDCVTDLELWSAKVRVGGIVAGHDYKDFPASYHIHVVEAVHGFVGSHYIRPWFVLGRARARRGEATETPRSFMWVKPDPQAPIHEWPRPYTLEPVR